VTTDFWLSILAAAICGALMGLERQLDGKPMGLRTGVLIAVGTATFMLLGESLSGQGDPTRVLGQLVTGVGFLGAGVLFKQKDGVVTGLTTAAVVWVLAAFGAAAGLGYRWEAVTLAIVSVVMLRLLQAIERRIPGLHKGHHSDDDADGTASS
jgi:putative Mg2+ transporter-C (MgtC) family protein